MVDVQRSRAWYVRMQGFRDEVEFCADGVLRGVGMHHPDADLRIALREDPERARALAGFDCLCLAVGTRGDLVDLLGRVRAAGATTTEARPGHRGWAADIVDPDGYLVRVHTLL